MNRPSIALCCILKNEVRNLPRLLASVEGCFDEIHLTDTGSTDGSLELIEKYLWEGSPAGTEIFLHNFQWVDDFAKARNYSFSHPKTDYVMWMDLDDVLSSRENFIEWRDTLMGLVDFWLATYHYAYIGEKPACSFARERVMRNGLGFAWKYFVHEGVLPKSPVKENITVQYAPSWTVNHMRNAADMEQDRSRNLLIFDKHKGAMDGRMRYYYGKELFENGKPLDAFPELVNAVAEPGLELHDRVMGIQYACMSAMALGQFEKAISLAHQGLALAPQRAELLIVIADSLLKQNRAGDAVPYFEAATHCSLNQGSIQGPLFQHEDYYRHYPLNQLSRIFANAADITRAEEYCDRALTLGPNAETMELRSKLTEIQARIKRPTGIARTKTDDIVISCPPQTLYEWDHDTYREKGLGGSETALCEMSTWLSQLSNRRVLIFNPAKTTKKFGAVEYRPNETLPEYLRDHSPACHIAWRHALRLSDDPMYVWCHDLGAQGLESYGNYHKVIALSGFHKKYLHHLYGIPNEKILVSRNGIEPKRFLGVRNKEFGKVVYSSSPDRGLDKAITVMDEVIKAVPEATLHVYYGFDNMKKMGLTSEVARLEGLMAARPYVKFHGNISQKLLTEETKRACVWLYPTNFLETYCITAIEMLCSGVYPVVRNYGALTDTLRVAATVGCADLINEGFEFSPREYVQGVLQAFMENRWDRVRFDANQFSWASVAKEWLSLLEISVKEETECTPLASIAE